MHTSFNSPGRQDRRQTQLAHLDVVKGLPERARGGALFALWPQKLPNTVRHVIDPLTRSQWRAARARATEGRIQKFLGEMARREAEIDQMMEHVEQAQVEEILLEAHGEQARVLTRAVGSLTGLKSIVIFLADGMRRKFDPNHEQDSQDLLVSVCMALNMGGGIVVRQQLALRVQVRNAQGAMEWRAQERVYGFSCGEGQWTALTAADMRNSYEHDQEGNRLEPDPWTSFGNGKDLVRGVK